MIFFGVAVFDRLCQCCYNDSMITNTYQEVIRKVKVIYEKSLELQKIINQVPCTVTENELHYLINDIQALSREVANTYNLIQK